MVCPQPLHPIPCAACHGDIEKSEVRKQTSFWARGWGEQKGFILIFVFVSLYVYIFYLQIN